MNAIPAVDPLESLFQSAKAHYAKVAAKAPKAKAEPPPDPRRVFTDPANWLPTRGVVLIHADTETLLGNFTEYVHRTHKDCRRLVREDQPLPAIVVERVTGSWWLSNDRQVIKPASWFERRPYVLHCDLSHLGVRSPCVEVNVCLEYGAIARIELAADTVFASEGEELMFLPRGLDILPVMSLDCKVQLRKDLGL